MWFVLFFFKQKTAYEMRISDGVQTCALPIYFRVNAKQLHNGIRLRFDAMGDLDLASKGAVAQLSRAIAEAQPLRRSEERSVGKECVSTCRSRWSPYHSKKNDNLECIIPKMKKYNIIGRRDNTGTQHKL